MAKERYWSKKSPEQKWDYIVVGSGMGGMTTAALLSHFGKKVLVLEQHYVPGGFTHTFRRKGYEWDVGVHAVGEVTTHTLPGRILHSLTNGSLEWASLGDIYEEMYYPDDFSIKFPNHPKKFRENLVEAFPEEEDAIDRYLSLIKEVSSAMRPYYLSKILPKWASGMGDSLLANKAQKFLEMRTKDVIDGLTDNYKLKQIFVAQWGYYGSLPSDSSFAIQALVVRHFYHGGFYPVGGSGVIATRLLKIVADAGGWTRICADVSTIILENGKAVGVELVDGEKVYSNRVISATGVLSTIKRLLPSDVQNQDWAQQICSDTRPSPAHICLNIGFKGDIRKAGCSSANKWFWNTWEMEEREWDFDSENIQDCPLLYCSFPSLKDPLHDPGEELRHTGEVVTFVPWETFSKWKDTGWRKRGEDYDELKKKLQDAILEQFLRHIPELRSMVDYVELSTPLSTEYFNRSMMGSIYGIEPTPERFQNPWLRPKSPIANLYLSGSDIASVGVIGAMMGGVLCAAAAEPLKAIPYLRKLM
jgi:all-trans-retinol 13,14-reductase